jgi:hypothetical protein
VADHEAKTWEEPPTEGTDLSSMPDQWFQTIFEGLLGPICVGTPDGRVLAINRTRPDLKVLYISGYNRSAGRSCQEMGPEENFLQKPFTPLELLHKVRQILDSAR